MSLGGRSTSKYLLFNLSQKTILINMYEEQCIKYSNTLNYVHEVNQKLHTSVHCCKTAN